MLPLSVSSQITSRVEQSVVAASDWILGTIPNVLLALLVLILFFILSGTIVGRVSSIGRSLGLFDSFEGTILGSQVDDVNDTVGAIVGTYVKVIGVLAALTMLDIGGTTQVVATVGWYATFAVAALAVVMIGAVIAKGVGDIAAHWDPVEGTDAAPVLSGLVQAFLYLVVLVVVLDLLGLPTSIVVAVADSIAFGLSLAAAIAVGLALGLGYKDEIVDYVDGFRN